jgi:hypothetical protein
VSRHLSQSCSVVTAGGGHLTTADGSSLLIGRGSTVVIPHSAGPAVLSGAIEGVRADLAEQNADERPAPPTGV